jgi:hypothetical protein
MEGRAGATHHYGNRLLPLIPDLSTSTLSPRLIPAL